MQVLARYLPETALHAALRRPTTQPSAASLSCAVMWIREVLQGVVNHPRINGMQGVRGSNPLSSTPGQRPDRASADPESSASRSRFAATRRCGRRLRQLRGLTGRVDVMPMLSTYFRALSEVMAAESRLLAQVYSGHRGKLGENREAVLQRFFSTYLPQRFGVGTGFALLGAEQVSTQQDVVIYDKLNNPVLFPESAARRARPDRAVAVSGRPRPQR
jgi:hypothetical protein